MIRRRDDHRHRDDYLRPAGLRQADPRRADRPLRGDFRLDHCPVGFQHLTRAGGQASANYRSSAECLGAALPID